MLVPPIMVPGTPPIMFEAIDPIIPPAFIIIPGIGAVGTGTGAGAVGTVGIAVWQQTAAWSLKFAHSKGGTPTIKSNACAVSQVNVNPSVMRNLRGLRDSNDWYQHEKMQ
jgi:hypothetical protein